MDQIGAFRHVIQFLEPIDVPQPSGQKLKSWNAYATAFASIVPVSSSEFFNAMQGMSQVTHTIRAWYDSRVKANHRVKYGNAIYEIVGPPRSIDKNDIVMEMMAIERGP